MKTDNKRSQKENTQQEDLMKNIRKKKTENLEHEGKEEKQEKVVTYHLKFNCLVHMKFQTNNK